MEVGWRGASGCGSSAEVEGWLRRCPDREKERKKGIEKRCCSTALISNFGLITAALYTSFEIPLFKHFAESCQCLFRANLWLPLQKGEDRRVVRHRQWEYIHFVLAPHTSLWQMGCAAFIGALVRSIALQYSCLAMSKLDWSFYFGKVKKSYYHLLCACRRVTGWVSRLWGILRVFGNLSSQVSLNWLYFTFWLNISADFVTVRIN